MDKKIKIGMKVQLKPQGEIDACWDLFIGKTFEVLSKEMYIEPFQVELKTPKGCKHPHVFVDNKEFWLAFAPIAQQLEFDFNASI
jgi:hypothetical protein